MYTANAMLADIINDILSWKKEYNIHMTADVIANTNVQTVKLLVMVLQALEDRLMLNLKQ